MNKKYVLFTSIISVALVATAITFGFTLKKESKVNTESPGIALSTAPSRGLLTTKAKTNDNASLVSKIYVQKSEKFTFKNSECCNIRFYAGIYSAEYNKNKNLTSVSDIYANIAFSSDDTNKFSFDGSLENAYTSIVDGETTILPSDLGNYNLLIAYTLRNIRYNHYTEVYDLKFEVGSTKSSTYFVNSRSEAVYNTNSAENIEDVFANNVNPIILHSDVRLTSSFNITKTTEIKLNGHTLTAANPSGKLFNVATDDIVLTIENGTLATDSTTKTEGFVSLTGENSELTFRGVNIDGVGNYIGTSESSGLIYANGKNQGINITGDNEYTINLPLLEDTVKSTKHDTRAFIFVDSDTKVDIKMNNANITYSGIVDGRNVINVWDGIDSTTNYYVNITNCKLTTTNAIFCEAYSMEVVYNSVTISSPTNSTYLGTGVATSGGGVSNVNNGSYTADYAAYVFNSGGTLNIAGGSFKGNKAAIRVDAKNEFDATAWIWDGSYDGKIWACSSNKEGEDKTSQINIKGGTFTNTVFQLTGSHSQIIITGGTFDADPTNYVDTTNYTVTKTGESTWTVKEK